jgi:hypothetical protein
MFDIGEPSWGEMHTRCPLKLASVKMQATSGRSGEAEKEVIGSRSASGIGRRKVSWATALLDVKSAEVMQKNAATERKLWKFCMFLDSKKWQNGWVLRLGLWIGGGEGLGQVA